MNKNFQLVLDEIIKKEQSSGRTPRLLLHSCCGPCSTYVLEYLSKYFDIDVFYYNPNIYPPEEFRRRLSAQEKVLNSLPFARDVGLIVPEYVPEEFSLAVRGLESQPEGGARCPVCFALRLRRTAQYARERGYDYFGTTLTVSPHKNALILNETGKNLEEKIGVSFLFSDFKKREGYKRSTVLSREYGIYRQDYCGCVFSLAERHGK